MLEAALFQIRIAAEITLELGLDREPLKNNQTALVTGSYGISARLSWHL